MNVVIKEDIDQTFNLRITTEKCQSNHIPLVVTFIDYEQAFSQPVEEI